jgi:hypothetical protein
MDARMLARLAFAVAVASIAFASPAAAQSCGSPPDPRTNTADYASWCSCMGGSYNYQTTACVGARGPTGGGYRDGSSGTWGCLARARNGAWGNSWSFGSEGEARARALSECRSRARGSPCSISACRTGVTASNPMRPGASAPAQRAPAQSAPPRQRPAYSCDLCARKLRADLNAGWASGRTISYAQQAIAGYQNCKRKARGSCDAGDLLERAVRNACFGFQDEPSFRRCLGRILQ